MIIDSMSNIPDKDEVDNSNLSEPNTVNPLEKQAETLVCREGFSIAPNDAKSHSERLTETVSGVVTGVVHTYLIHCPATNRVKIGRAKNPIQRMRDLSTAASSKLDMLGYWIGDNERELHKDFFSLRRGGEWFDIDARFAEFIKKRTGRRVFYSDAIPPAPPAATHRVIEGVCTVLMDARFAPLPEDEPEDGYADWMLQEFPEINELASYFICPPQKIEDGSEHEEMWSELQEALDLLCELKPAGFAYRSPGMLCAVFSQHENVFAFATLQKETGLAYLDLDQAGVSLNAVCIDEDGNTWTIRPIVGMYNDQPATEFEQVIKDGKILPDVSRLSRRATGGER